MKTTLPILALFISVFNGCAVGDPRENQSDDIREAVFRYQLEHRSFGQGKRAAVCIFALPQEEDKHKQYGLSSGLPPFGDKENDPSQKLMSRFRNHRSPILKNSEFNKGNPSDTGSYVRFRVTTIKWLSDTEVEVKGGHDDASSASWSDFTVKKEKGIWKVTHAELRKGRVA